MNLDNERKAFKEWIKNEDPFIGNDDNPDCIWAKKYMWKAWLASANREGYKLVPVELIKSCNDIAVDCFNRWDIKKEAMPDICELMQDFSYYLQSHDRSL